MTQKANGLSDEEFINICYERVLRRSPDPKGKKHYLNALKYGGMQREEVLLKFISCEEFESKLTTAGQEFVPSGHFYSAVPSLEERWTFLSSNHTEQEPCGIHLNTEKQMELLRQFQKYYDECPFPSEGAKNFRYYFSNPAYSYGDALTLYCMIRHYSPQRIIEIGSGFSSCVILDTNEHFFDDRINLTFIEPYPELLRSLIRGKDKTHAIIEKKLQEVDKDIFCNLEENDILLVDSTHVSKLNSDVNKIIFDIMPSLGKGVLVHFHDIFWPFEYPKNWIKEGRAWNEAYILRAFLEFNKDFEIRFFADYLCQKKSEYFRKNMPLYLKNSGGNIWVQRVNS